MIGQVKGCLNKRCSEYHKRYYKASDVYCVKCGEKLSFVCKQRKCFKQLPDGCKDKYCAAHLAERADKRGNTGKKAVAASGGILAVGASIAGVTKSILKK